VARFTDNLANAAFVVEPAVVMPVTLSDLADDPVLYTAADGKADVLCTLNTRHFSTSAAQAFCKEHSIRVMTDIEVLREFFWRRKFRQSAVKVTSLANGEQLPGSATLEWDHRRRLWRCEERARL
jgi:hypothetical protein